MLNQEKEFLDLLQGIRDHSEEAARKFVDTYGPAILRIIRRRLAPKMRKQFDSIDFLQDVYASFLCKPSFAEVFTNPKAFFDYLAKMAKNKVFDAMRRQGRQKRDIHREFSLEGSAHIQAGGLQVSDPTPSAVVRAMDEFQGLPPAQQEVLDLLRTGHSLKEIVERLGLHPKWVQRIKRSLHAKVVS